MENHETDAPSVEEVARHRARIKKPSRTIIVEPLLVICALAGFPMMLLTQQYTFKRMAEQVAEDHGIHGNYSLPDTSKDPCEQGEGNDSSPLANYTDEIQRASSNFAIYSTVVASGPSLFITLFLGAYSDRVGRKYAIVPPILAGLSRTLVYIIVVFLNLSPYYLFIGSFMAGLGGGYQTLLLGCFAYVADITLPEKRSFRIVIAEFCMIITGVLTPAGVGMWIQKSGYFWPFMCVLGGEIISVIYAIFLIPETVIPDPEARFFTCSHIKDTVVLYTKDNGTRRRWKLDMLLLTFFIAALVGLGGSGISTLFEMNHPLCWGSNRIGIFNAAYIGVTALGAIIMARLLKLCLSDQMICLVAAIVLPLGQIYFGLVQNSYMMIAVPLFPAVSALFIPMLRGLMSKMVLADEQGAMFGSIACLEVVCGLLGSVLLNLVYMSTINIYTGLVYFVMAGITTVGCVVYVTMLLLARREKNIYSPLVDADVLPIDA